MKQSRKAISGEVEMEDLDALHEFGRELERRIRLQTFPLAVKVLRRENEIPAEAFRPMGHSGYHLATCQGLALSRREGTLVAQTKEDMWCPESVIGLGLAEPPRFFLEGHHRFPQSTESLEAGSVWAQAFPRFEPGECVGVLSAPLTEARFIPDVVVIYCDAHQLGTLLLAASSKTGHEVTCTVSSKGACVYSIVAPVKNEGYQVTAPCPGDRRYAMAQRDELIFSLHRRKVPELLTSLRYLDQYAYRLPLRCIMHPEAELPENYVELGKMIGMRWMKGNELAKYK
jgi:uncharacterized protein (DUF169 family)